MTRYTCTQCGLTVVVDDAISPDNLAAIKACGCEAPIIAEIAADMAGTGGM